ncbi:MAG: ATP-binding protein [Sedimenticola sp.]
MGLGGAFPGAHGKDEATRNCVFDPFFTTRPTGVGTGLGLSISYFIITQEHGGEMIVESEPGEGARFIIKLPLKISK